jgi:uncharacterized OB-fold protein
MSDEVTRLLPFVDDPDTSGFFEAAARGELVVRQCNDCDAVLHVPRMYCRFCRSWNGRWQPVDGRASLYSWTVVTHQVHPAYPTPYTLVLVDLDEAPGTHFVGQLPGAHELQAGIPMEVVFEVVGSVDGRPTVVPNWRPV